MGRDPGQPRVTSDGGCLVLVGCFADTPSNMHFQPFGLPHVALGYLLCTFQLLFKASHSTTQPQRFPSV